MATEDVQHLAKLAAPHVEAALRDNLASGTPTHLGAVSPAVVVDIAGKIVAALPMLIQFAINVGVPIPAQGPQIAAWAAQAYANLVKTFPSL